MGIANGAMGIAKGLMISALKNLLWLSNFNWQQLKIQMILKLFP